MPYAKVIVFTGVAEDRECDRPNANCRCSKAAKIHSELTVLAKKLNNAEQVKIRNDLIDNIDFYSSKRKIKALVISTGGQFNSPTKVQLQDPLFKN